jgi:hypothetical protein
MPKEPVYELAFSAGIDQSVRPEVLDPRAAWVALENVRQVKSAGAQKRFGFSAKGLTRLDTAYGSRSAGRRMFTHGLQTCIIDGTYLDTWGPTDGNVTASKVPEVALSWKRLAATSLPTDSAFSSVNDCIVVGTRVIVASVVGGATSVAWATVYDYETGQVLVPPDSLAVGTRVVLGSYGNYAVALIANGTSVAMYYIDTSAAGLDSGWSSGGNVATDRASGLSCTSLTAGIAFAYVNNLGGTSRATVKVATPMGVTATQTINTASVTPDIVNVAGSTSHGTLWVVWNQGTTVRVCGLNPANIAATVATTDDALTIASSGPSYVDVAAGSSAGTCYVIADTYPVSFCEVTTNAGAAVAGGQVDSTGAEAIGRPLNIGGKYYVLMSYLSQGQAILCEFSNASAYFRPVANAFPSLASTSTRAKIALAGSKYVTPINVTRSSVAMSPVLLEFDFASLTRWRPTFHNGVTYLSGGLTSYFDGERVVEACTLASPNEPSGATGAAGNPLGDYRAVAVYEHVDAAGNWTISGVSEPSEVVTAASEVIAWTVAPLNITSRPYEAATGLDNRVRVVFYKTAAGGEPPYYRMGTVDNDPSMGSASYSDDWDDNDLITQAELYAPNLPGVDGGAQDRRAPPGFQCMASYNGMLVGAAGGDVYWSSQTVSGEAVWFNPAFSQPVAQWLLSLEPMDGTLFAFDRTGIYAMAGEPPADNGSGGGLGPPQRLATDVGASQAFTCVTSLGIFFVSDRGIELFTRARSVEYIGEKVQDTFASFPYVTAMTFDPSSSSVIIELASSVSSGAAAGTGRTLVYDTRRGIWQSVDRRKNSSGTADTPAQDGCVVWNGSAWRYAWLGTEGRLYVEDQATHLDPGSAWVQQYARASWVHVSGLQGHQIIDRVLLLADQSTDHDITMGVAHDYDDSTFIDKDWDSDALDALTTMWLDRDVTQDQGQAIMVELTDATPTGDANTVGTGKGGTWVALTFSGEPRSGVKRTAYTHRGGT